MSSNTMAPCSDRFSSVAFRGNVPLSDLGARGASEQLAEAGANWASKGDQVFWGLPFRTGSRAVGVTEGGRPSTIKLGGICGQWLVLAHTSDRRPSQGDARGFTKAPSGEGRLGEHAADYVFVYEDGSEERVAIRRRHQIGIFTRRWGENCVESVAHTKPHALPAPHEILRPGWGHAQTRATAADGGPFVLWLWAWENPHPRKPLAALRVEPISGVVLLVGGSVGKASAHPLRWEARRKAVLKLPARVPFDAGRDQDARYAQVALDMGSVISATPRPVYPAADWTGTYNNAVPEISEREVLVEYTAHADACFQLHNGRRVPVSRIQEKGKAGPLSSVPSADQRVRLKVIDRESRRPVAVKLHVHGVSGEYLPPMDRHRIPNPCWYEDYSCDYLNQGIHLCTYIPGETELRLPLGDVFIEVSKGVEVRPVRLRQKVTRRTDEIVIEIEKVLPWRERNWVSADTHVHFLSPQTGLLEGAAEGVNVVNLLASQWGELMTNVGDFDGATTHRYNDGGDAAEYMVRVGTENRQHVLGHISLIGYNGPLIAPMCSGGPDEAALGDPVEVLLTEWARQCRAQDGVVVIPHFPNPRMEHAATIVEGDADAVEMTAWGDLYSGINPYTLSDWYRYLNNGYFVAAVGGTDKMSATTAVGAVRTYARLPNDEVFTYDGWKDAVRRGETFVTYGPLMEVAVDGQPLGARMQMTRSGGTVNVTWKVASVTVPMTSVELVANGEVIAGCAVDAEAAEGVFSVSVERSTWLALLVRGQYPDKPEMIAAHSSPVMIQLEGSPFYSAADMVTILEQVEGALAYVDVLGTRAETKAYKRMRLVLTSAHRALHNRMHCGGVYHEHTPVTDHADHH